MGVKPQITKFSTESLDEAQQFLAARLSECRVRQVDHTKAFRFSMESLNLGHVTLIRNYYACTCRISAAIRWDELLFVSGQGAPTSLVLEGHRVVVSEQQAVIIPPSASIDIHRPAGSVLRLLKVSPTDLEHHLIQMTGRHQKGRLSFAKFIPLNTGPGKLVNMHMNYLEQLFDSDADPITSEMVRCYDMILLCSLLSLPHSLSDELGRDPDHLAKITIVQRVETYLMENIERKTGVNELVEIFRCSKSTLFDAFKTVRGYSPMEYITEQRLQKAWASLMKPAADASVSSVAMECGFTHLGRFSQAYHSRFGEKPSETLNKGKE